LPIPDPDRTGYLPLGVYPATLDEIEARFATTPERMALMNFLREAVHRITRLGCAKRIFVVGCFIGPREHTKDVDLMMTVDPAVGLEERGEGTFALRLEILRKALLPEVDLTPIDDDLPAVDELLKFFQRDTLEHGGYDRGILQLVV
jgi:hypothetical protein